MRKKKIILLTVIIALFVIAVIFVLYYITHQQTINTINELKSKYTFINDITYRHVNSPTVSFSVYTNKIIDVDEGEMVFSDFLERLNNGLLKELHSIYKDRLHFIIISFYLENQDNFLLRFSADGNDDFNKWGLECSERFFSIGSSNPVYTSHREYFRL